MYLYINIYMCVCVCVCERERERCSLSYSLLLLLCILTSTSSHASRTMRFLSFTRTSRHISPMSHTQNTLLLKFESLPLCCWFLNNSFLRGKSDLGAERYVEVRERVSVCVCVCIKAGKREEGGEWVGG